MAKQDKTKEEKPVKEKPVKEVRPVKEEKKIKCPTCQSKLTKEQATTLKMAGLMKVAPSEEALETSSVSEMPFTNVKVTDLTSKYFTMDYQYDETPVEYPILILDLFENGQGGVLPQYRVWFPTDYTQKELDELQLQLDALPLDSRFKVAFGKYVERIVATWDSNNNPPEEPVIEEPPPTPPPFPGL